ncbi:MAG: hypothetical protein SGCHY_004939 [Lobulomycetales sp.]
MNSISESIASASDCLILSSWIPDAFSGLNCCRDESVTCDNQGRVVGISLTGLGLQASSFGNAASLAELSELTSLRITKSRLSGIPDISVLAGQLLELDLSGNGIAGDMPESLLEFTKLVDLNLSDNRFTGTVPDLSLLHRLSRSSCDLRNSGAFGLCLETSLSTCKHSLSVCGLAPATSTGSMRTTWVGITVGILLLALFITLALLAFLWCRRRQRKMDKTTILASTRPVTAVAPANPSIQTTSANKNLSAWGTYRRASPVRSTIAPGEKDRRGQANAASYPTYSSNAPAAGTVASYPLYSLNAPAAGVANQGGPRGTGGFPDHPPFEQAARPPPLSIPFN